MNTIWAFLVGLVLATAVTTAKLQKQYVPIQVVSMASGEVIDIKIDPMVFVVELAGETNVRIYFRRNEEDGFSLLIPVGQVVDLRKDYRSGGN